MRFREFYGGLWAKEKGNEAVCGWCFHVEMCVEKGNGKVEYFAGFEDKIRISLRQAWYFSFHVPCAFEIAVHSSEIIAVLTLGTTLSISEHIFDIISIPSPRVFQPTPHVLPEHDVTQETTQQTGSKPSSRVTHFRVQRAAILLVFVSLAPCKTYIAAVAAGGVDVLLRMSEPRTAGPRTTATLSSMLKRERAMCCATACVTRNP